MASATPDPPRFTIFAGPNGSGKSTAYLRFLAAGYDAGEYLNPDDIAKELGAVSAAPAVIDLRAGREVIRRSRDLMQARRPFVRETTLSSREILRSVSAAADAGYRVVMVFVALGSTAVTKTRVALRVVSGGHDIPEEAQDRRFGRSFDNAPKVARIVHAAYFLDNSGAQHRLVAAVRGGTTTFLDAQQAQWVMRATSGLPQAASLLSRADALTQLREAERLDTSLEVREERAVYRARAASAEVA